jgi:hypothetical protein
MKKYRALVDLANSDGTTTYAGTVVKLPDHVAELHLRKGNIEPVGNSVKETPPPQKPQPKPKPEDKKEAINGDPIPAND